MDKEPNPDKTGKVRVFLWESYTDVDGSIVPFEEGAVGAAVPGTNDSEQLSATIYLNQDEALGGETSDGLLNTLAHELMHAIQYAMGAKGWGEYQWLMEAMAVWAEDFVYKDANSEWGQASWFLDYADLPLSSSYKNHEYGAYLLPYFLTHTVDSTNEIIRDIWTNAATYDNSYLAIRDAVPEASTTRIMMS
jgi:hypothetical protein